MAKDYSDRTKALDDIFKRLMVNSGITPAGSDIVESIKGTRREQWAFPQDGSAGINVTPFQDRPLADQKILGELLDKMYGHGASYEYAAAQKLIGGAAAANAANEAERFKFLKKELEKKLAGESSTAVGGGVDDYTGMPPWAEKVPKPGVAIPGGAAGAPTAARTTGYGPGKPSGTYDFSMTPEKAALLGINLGAADKKKKKTGNLWEDEGFASFSTLK